MYFGERAISDSANYSLRIGVIFSRCHIKFASKFIYYFNK